MTVAKKNIDVERKKFIEKGGSSTIGEDKIEFTNICLRIPKSMVEEIDTLVKNKPGFTRTTWILQTIHKQLKIEQFGFNKED